MRQKLIHDVINDMFQQFLNGDYGFKKLVERITDYVVKRDQKYELHVNGDFIGVFPTEGTACKYAETYYSDDSYSVLPLGTLIFYEDDLEEE